VPEFKFNAIFGLQPGIDPDETYREWRGDHAEYAKNFTLPEVRRYNINRVIHRFGDTSIEDIWGVAEFWFDDMASAQRAAERLRDAKPDEFHTKRITPAKRFISQEEEIVDSEPTGDMIKLVSVFSLRPGVDADEAYKIWREKYIFPLVKDAMTPGAKRCALNRVIHKYPPAGGGVARFDFFAYVIFWFDDMASTSRAAGLLRNAHQNGPLAQFATVPQTAVVAEENIL